MITLSKLWTLFRHSPRILAILSLMIESFGSDEFKEVLEALGNFFRKIAPPAPTTDSTGTTPVNPEPEKRKWFLRLRRRLNIAGRITDMQEQDICTAYQINPNEKETMKA